MPRRPRIGPSLGHVGDAGFTIIHVKGLSRGFNPGDDVRIVGDIEDEYDSVEAAYIQTIAPQTYLVNARLDIDSLAELLDIELPEEHVDTLGGFMYSLLGRVPDQGESVEYAGRLFTVVGLDGRRIAQVRVEPVIATTVPNKAESRQNDASVDSREFSNALSLNKERGAQNG